MKLTEELLKEYKNDVCYIEYEIKDDSGVLIYDIEKIEDNKYKEILSNYLCTEKNIEKIKHKIINYINELDNFTATIRYFNYQGVQKMFCYMGYKKKAGYFIELCERPYKLAIKNNNPKEELVEFNTNHNILKEALFAEENFLNTLSNLLLVNINCLSEFEWLLHDKSLNSTYSTKSAVKIEAKPLEERTKKQQYTKIMLHAIEDENEIEKALDYCKKITSFIHCPIQLNDYKRMDAYKENKELLNQVYKTTKELKQPIGNNTITTNNKIFFWYSIALLSITSFNRDEYDSYLEQLIIEAKNNYLINKSDFVLLKRNFEVLKKEYKYLEKYFIDMDEYLQTKQN